MYVSFLKLGNIFLNSIFFKVGLFSLIAKSKFDGENHLVWKPTDKV